MSLTRILGWILALGLLIPGCTRGPESEPVLIGHIARFTGSDKNLGERSKQAMLLAVEEVNKEVNRVGNRRVAVLHPSFELDPVDPLQTLSSLSVRLLKVNRVTAIVGGQESDEAKVIGRAAATSDTAVVTVAECAMDLIGDNVFSVSPNLATQGRILAQFALKDLAKNRLAVLIDSRRGASTTVGAAFAREALTRLNRLQVHEWSYKSAADFSDLVSRIKQAQVELIVHAGTVGDLARLQSRLLALSLKLPILFAGDFVHLEQLKIELSPGSSIYLATPYIPECDTPENKRFVQEYRKRFGDLPDAQAALAHDALMLVLEGMRRARSLRPERILAELRKADATPWPSLTGTYKFDKARCAARPLFMTVVENEQSRLIKTIKPEDN